MKITIKYNEIEEKLQHITKEFDDAKTQLAVLTALKEARESELVQQIESLKADKKLKEEKLQKAFTDFEVFKEAQNQKDQNLEKSQSEIKTRLTQAIQSKETAERDLTHRSTALEKLQKEFKDLSEKERELLSQSNELRANKELELSQLRTTLALRESSMNELKTQNVVLQTMSNAKDQEILRINASHEEELAKKLKTARTESEMKEKELAKSLAEVRELNTHLLAVREQLEKDKKATEANLSKLQSTSDATIADLKNEVKTKQEAETKLLAELEDVKLARDASTTANGQLEKIMNTLQEEMSRISAKVEEERKKSRTLQTEKDQIASQLKTVSEKEAKVSKEIKDIRSGAELTRLRQENQAVIKERDHLKHLGSASIQKQVDLCSQMDKLEDETNVLRQVKDRLEAQLKAKEVDYQHQLNSQKKRN